MRGAMNPSDREREVIDIIHNLTGKEREPAMAEKEKPRFVLAAEELAEKGSWRAVLVSDRERASSSYSGPLDSDRAQHVMNSHIKLFIYSLFIGIMVGAAVMASGPSQTLIKGLCLGEAVFTFCFFLRELVEGDRG